jgi:hypothetical protein
LPEGHLELQPGDRPIKLYVWLVQIKDDDEGGDAAAAGFQDIDGLSRSRSSWFTRNDVVYDGKFKPGIAVGLALAVLEEVGTGKQKARWWSETIRLE